LLDLLLSEAEVRLVGLEAGTCGLLLEARWTHSSLRYSLCASLPWQEDLTRAAAVNLSVTCCTIGLRASPHATLDLFCRLPSLQLVHLVSWMAPCVDPLLFETLAEHWNSSARFAFVDTGGCEKEQSN